MNILQIGQFLDARGGGGIATACQGLHDALNQAGIESHLIGFRSAASHSPCPPHTVFLAPRPPAALYYSEKLWPELKARLDGVESLHVHGLWVYPNFVAGRASRRAACPLVIHPHGMLEPWALANSPWRKRAARLLFENANFRHARLWRALTVREADQIRKWQPGARVCVVPNGIWASEFQKPQPREVLLEPFPSLAQKKWVLFLSRINLKKGLDILLRAWAQVRARFPDWVLTLAGPDAGYLAPVQSLIAELRVESSVLLAGLVEGTIKEALLQHAAFFVLPSYSEGFSMALLEALASGLPCLITPHCHFDQVERSGAGLSVEPTQASVAHALSDLLEQSDAARRSMSKSARALAAQYDWSALARRFAAELSSL
jgi:glycosyltransferase involved in cell wall biosynthesis